jgi:hypothetical protein
MTREELMSLAIPARDRLVAFLASRGINPRDIGAVVGRSPNHIYSDVARMGLRRKSNPRLKVRVG